MSWLEGGDRAARNSPITKILRPGNTHRIAGLTAAPTLDSAPDSCVPVPGVIPMRPAMRLAAAAVPALGVLLAAGACAKPKSVTSQGTIAVQEIRPTTASEEARNHYAAGERLLDVGRPQEASVHFRKAVETDSTFAYAYLGIANSAQSTQEFKENLDAAARHAEGKSEGERLLIDVNRAFFINDAERALELSQKLTQTYPNSPRAWLTLRSEERRVGKE